jgi:hypothetical protein
VAALLARTGGNPWRSVELPSTLTSGQLSGKEPLPDRLPLTRPSSAASSIGSGDCRSRAERLLVASADDSGLLRVVRDAALAVGAGGQALVEAEEAGLVVTDADAIRVTHPLVRSATYQAATGGERRAATARSPRRSPTSGTPTAGRGTWPPPSTDPTTTQRTPCGASP